MQNDNKQRILNLSDADFLSFLYSERDRENSLNQVPGWNRWVLYGAAVTIICTAFVTLRNNEEIKWLNVLYISSGIISSILFVSSLIRTLPQGRGYDSMKVRTLSEVSAKTRIFFVLLCSIAFVILIPILDDCNMLLWFWGTLMIAYIVGALFCYFRRNEIVHAFYFNVIFPWPTINTYFEALTGALFGLIINESFRMMSTGVLTPEVEFSSCIGAFLVVLFFICKIHGQEHSVVQVDAIIDGFLYGRVSKEETYRRIAMHRMGYGVLDACYQELRLVEKKLKTIEEEEIKLDETKQRAINNELSVTQLGEVADHTDVILNQIQEALNLSEKLTGKLDRIVAVSEALRNISEFEMVFDKNREIYSKVKSVLTKTKEVSRLIHEKQVNILTELSEAIERVEICPEINDENGNVTEN